jgi:hypothetical protein
VQSRDVGFEPDDEQRLLPGDFFVAVVAEGNPVIDIVDQVRSLDLPDDMVRLEILLRLAGRDDAAKTVSTKHILPPRRPLRSESHPLGPRALIESGGGVADCFRRWGAGFLRHDDQTPVNSVIEKFTPSRIVFCSILGATQN